MECAYELPGELRSARRARAIVASQLARWGETRLVDAANVCVSELVTNAVLHAGTAVQLELALLPGRVRVGVQDGDPTPPERTEAAPDDERGRGMTIVERMTDAWGVDVTPEGKRIWFDLLTSGAF